MEWIDGGVTPEKDRYVICSECGTHILVFGGGVYKFEDIEMSDVCPDCGCKVGEKTPLHQKFEEFLQEE